jgi:hypothetical protein
VRSWRALLTELASPAVAARGALHKIADRLLRSKDLLGQVERRPAPGFPVAKAHAVVGCAFARVATRCAPARCRVPPQPHLLLLKHLRAVLCCAGLRRCVRSRGSVARWFPHGWLRAPRTDPAGGGSCRRAAAVV